MRLSRPFLVAVIAAAGFVPAACELTPERPEYPSLRFNDQAPIKFDVAEIEIETAYKPSAEPPNVELLFPLRLDEAATAWARDRLVAAGSTRRLRFVVSEASVIQTDLETETGVSGAVTVDQAERYNARLVVDVELVETGDFVSGNATARAQRSITVPENASLNDREQTWYVLTQKLMDDMNAQLEETLRKVFFRFLR